MKRFAFIILLSFVTVFSYGQTFYKFISTNNMAERSRFTLKRVINVNTNDTVYIITFMLDSNKISYDFKPIEGNPLSITFVNGETNNYVSNTIASRTTDWIVFPVGLIGYRVVGGTIHSMSSLNIEYYFTTKELNELINNKIESLTFMFANNMTYTNKCKNFSKRLKSMKNSIN